MYVKCHHFNSLQYSQLCLEGRGFVFKTLLFAFLCFHHLNELKLLLWHPSCLEIIRLSLLLTDVCIFVARRLYGAAKSASSTALGSTRIIVGGGREGLLLHVRRQLGVCHDTSRNRRHSLNELSVSSFRTAECLYIHNLRPLFFTR